VNGLVEKFNNRRGYGLVRPLIGKPKETPLVFFHVSAIKGRRRGEDAGVPIGAEVSFDLIRGKDGKPQAWNLEVVKLQKWEQTPVRLAPDPTTTA
jgi:cold shock CspA family protein